MKTLKKLPGNIGSICPNLAVHPLIFAGVLIACAIALTTPCLAVNRVFCVTNAPYGAVPDDGADDTAAIQSALNAAASAFNTPDSAGRSGVAVIFPSGTYKINSRLNLTTTGCSAEGGGIMIRGEGRAGTIIQSSGLSGALRLAINVDGGTARIQIEDIQFQANAVNAGPAIEVAPYMANGLPLEETRLNVTPVVRNVRIARTATNYYYSYGFKGNNLKLPLIDDVIIIGSNGCTEAGICFSNTYAHNIKDCTIDGAKVGVDHYIGGEGNMFNRMIITNVMTGIRVENKLYHVLMSTEGGTVLSSTISASECGVSLKHKSFCAISNSKFNRLAGGTSYLDVKLTDCSECFITGNNFASGANQTNVALIKGVETLSGSSEIMVSDNTFGSSSGTGVSVGSGVERAMIFNNQFGMSTFLADSGTSTFFAAGTPCPFVSPAAAKDTESFGWNEAMGTVYNVTNAPYYAKGDGATDDTLAIQAAASALVTYLNGAADRKAVLYFPAGTYKVTGQISMAPTNGAAKLTIRGDGMRVSVIERYSGGTKGVFKLDFANTAGRADIHNLMVFARYSDAGDAVYLRQPAVPNVNTPRNLYMHNILIDRRLAADSFSNAVNGVNAAKPFLENVFITMSGADTVIAGTAGVSLTDSWGFECDKLMIGGGGLDKGMNIKSKGGDVLIKNTTGCVVAPNIGARIDAGGGRVAVESAHFNNSEFSLDLTNAIGVSLVNFQTLTHDVTTDAGRASVRVANCQNVNIRNCAFTKSHPLFFNPNRKSIWLHGTANSGVTNYGNMFMEPGGTCVYTPGCTPIVTNNFFSRTDVDDIQGGGSQIMTRLYQLNGEVGKEYLLKNKTNGKYLNANGTAVACAETDIGDDVLWTAVYDRASGLYTLKNKKEGRFLTKNGSSVNCTGTTVNANTQWTIVNQQDGLYNIKNGSNMLDYDPTDTVDCSETANVSDTQWEAILSDDLEMGMDKGTVYVTQTSATTWTNVNFIQPFPHPPAVFVGGPSCNDSAPLTVRVRNVTTTNFALQLDEWTGSDGVHSEEEVSFIALHKGSYQVDQSGTRSIEAGTVTAGTNWVTKTFNVPFSTVPCVFAQCTSTNGAPCVAARVRNVTATNFQVRIQEGSLDDGIHVAESIDFIAIDPGSNLYFQTGRTTPGPDHNWKSLTFTNKWSLPGFIGSVQSYNDAQPCALRYQALTGTNVQIKVDEDSSDGETVHGPEDAGWMVFSNVE